jgi:hypothetical protein
MRYCALVPDPVIGRLIAYLDKAGHPVEFQAVSQDDANKQAKAMRLPPAVMLLPDELRQSKHDQRAAGAACSRRGAPAVGGVVDSGRRRHTPPHPNASRKPNAREGNSTYVSCSVRDKRCKSLSHKFLGSSSVFQTPRVRADGLSVGDNDAQKQTPERDCTCPR